MHLLALHRATGFPVVFTRAANVYGPGQQIYRIVPRAALSARLGRQLLLHGAGESLRAFIHIDDVVDATLQVAKRGQAGECYHVSTDEIISVRDLVLQLFRIAGVDHSGLVIPTQDRLGKDFGYLLDSSKIRHELGWEPTVKLDDGLNTVMSWIDSDLEELASLPTEYFHQP